MPDALIIIIILFVWLIISVFVWLPEIKERIQNKKCKEFPQPSEDYNDRAIQHILLRMEAQEFRQSQAEEAEEKEYIEYQSFCQLLNLVPCALKSIALFNRVREKAHKFYEEEIAEL
ncbi:MAG: hypothetical protein J6C53_01970 [Clostridia bacterium]|nr:hypothetical protein [Clostridia bacterium]